MVIFCCLLDQQTSSHPAEVLLFDRVSSTIRKQFGSFRVASESDQNP